MSSHKCISPNDGAVFSEIGLSNFRDVDSWIKSHRKAVIAEQDRIHLLRDLSKSILQSSQELSDAIQKEVGKTPEEAQNEVFYAASFVDSALVSLQIQLQKYGFDAGMPHKSPLGTALLITAFNDPIAGITRKLAPAIAAGCPVVIKPSPLGFFCAKTFQQCLPDSLRDLIIFAYLENPQEIRCLIAESDISIVSMTGSTAAGRQIAETAGKKAIPCVLELGGNCPFVVFENADLKKAARDLLDRKSRAAGQACSSVNRVLVDSRIAKALQSELQAIGNDYLCGPSQIKGVSFGPVRSLESLERLKRLQHSFQGLGADLILRAGVLGDGQGYTYPLTAFRLDRDSPLDHEEAFGPLFVVRQFASHAELEALIDTNRQNLAAYFYGDNPEAFLECRPWIRFGSIGLNTTKIQGPDVPTGGFGEAGYGREGGYWGIDEFQATVNKKGVLK